MIAENAIGRAKIALVHGVEGVAIITDVQARVVKESSRERLRLAGTARFEPAVAKHLSEVVTPAAVHLLERLGIHVSCFEVALINVSAASATDSPVEVVGFSADVPVFLAMLSAGLDVPLSGSLLATGHLASPAADITMVKGLRAKLDAAVRHSIKLFFYPAIDRDVSLKMFSPGERDQIVKSLSFAAQHIHAVPVIDVADLVTRVFSRESIVLAGLRHGFFATGEPVQPAAMPLDRAADYLLSDSENRFWGVVEEHLFARGVVLIRQVLEARVAFQMRLRQYPTGFGARLLAVVKSLPPATRQFSGMFPLLPTAACIALSQLAAVHQEEDVPLLFDAARGSIYAADDRTPAPSRAGPGGADAGSAVLDAVIAQIDAAALAQYVSLPIDTARETFTAPSVTIRSAEAFNQTIAAFWLHLNRHRNRIIQPPADAVVKANAIALLEAAFAKRGGYKAALAEARGGINGGLRFVVNAMVEQYRFEERRKHVTRVLKEAVDPMDRQAQVAFTAELFRRLERHLPPEMLSHPQYYSDHYEEIAEAYVEMTDRLAGLLRTF